MSQMNLALEAGVSARHLSFVESGRSRASQDLVLRFAEALGLSLRDRNGLLVAAGFAPQFGESDWENESLAEVRRAAELILDGHRPYPALVLDAATDVLAANEPALLMMGARREDLPGLNLVRLVFLEGPVRASIVNWEQVASYMLHRLREAARSGGPVSKAVVLLAEMSNQPGAADLSPHTRWHGSVLLPLVFSRDGIITRWFTTVTSFGGPREALAEELTIEQFYPQ